MNRWAALLLSIAGGAILGYFLLLAFAGIVLGIAWLYVFGDDPWPVWSNYVLGAAIVVAGAGCWAFCSWLIWTWLRPRR